MDSSTLHKKQEAHLDTWQQCFTFFLSFFFFFFLSFFFFFFFLSSSLSEEDEEEELSEEEELESFQKKKKIYQLGSVSNDTEVEERQLTQSHNIVYKSHLLLLFLLLLLLLFLLFFILTVGGWAVRWGRGWFLGQRKYSRYSIT